MPNVRYAVEVVAGLLPGRDPDPEFTRRWFVTSEEWAARQVDSVSAMTAPTSPWSEAVAYATSLVDPSRVNWVKVEWVWF